MTGKSTMTFASGPVCARCLKPIKERDKVAIMGTGPIRTVRHWHCAYTITRKAAAASHESGDSELAHLRAQRDDLQTRNTELVEARRVAEAALAFVCAEPLRCACRYIDDGSSFALASYAGGAAREGLYGSVTCEHRKPDGTVEMIHYVRAPAAGAGAGEEGKP